MRKKVDIPLPPEPSEKVARLLRELSRCECVGECEHPDTSSLLFHLSETPEEFRGYIRVCHACEDAVTTHKVYAVVKICELDVKHKIEYYEIFFRRFAEEDLHDLEDDEDGEFGRGYIADEVRLGHIEGEWLSEAHFIKADGSISPSFSFDVMMYRKVFAFPAGVEIPYGTKRNQSRRILTRLNQEQAVQFMNRALYLESMGDPRSADPIHPLHGW